MNTIEGIGHREHVDGDAVDYLTSSRSNGGRNREPVCNHGLRAKIKRSNRRRDRRGTRQALRTGSYSED
jgi:hypothetical protein